MLFMMFIYHMCSTSYAQDMFVSEKRSIQFLVENSKYDEALTEALNCTNMEILTWTVRYLHTIIIYISIYSICILNILIP